MSNPVNFISGRLIKRYKRFFADVKLDSGEVVTAHCPNTGSMMGLLTEGNIVYLSKTDNEKRKLKYTLEIIRDEQELSDQTMKKLEVAMDEFQKNFK